MITLSCPLVLCSLFPCSLYEGYWAYFRYPADHECSWLERFSGKTFSTEHIKHAGTDFASRIHRPDTASILVNRDTHLLLRGSRDFTKYFMLFFAWAVFPQFHITHSTDFAHWTKVHGPKVRLAGDYRIWTSL